MRTLILLLILVLVGIVGTAVLVPKPCTGDDCNYGKRCFTDSQCECDLVCRRIPDGLGSRRCEF